MGCLGKADGEVIAYVVTEGDGKVACLFDGEVVPVVDDEVVGKVSLVRLEVTVAVMNFLLFYK